MGRPSKSDECLINDAIKRGAIKHGDHGSLVRDGKKVLCGKCDENVNWDRNNINARINEHLIKSGTWQTKARSHRH